MGGRAYRFLATKGTGAWKAATRNWLKFVTFEFFPILAVSSADTIS
jgi:hypothetical protein